MTERLFQVTRGSVCAGFIARPYPEVHQWLIHDAAPILRKAVGRELREVIESYRRSGASVVEVKSCELPS